MIHRWTALLLGFNFICCTNLPRLNLADIYTHEQAHLTPLLAYIDDMPQAFYGSDKKYHLAYELNLVNYNKLSGSIEKIKIINALHNQVVFSFNKKELSSRLRPFGAQIFTNILDAGQSSAAFIHLIFDNRQAIPSYLIHEVKIKFLDNTSISEQLALIEVNKQEPLLIGAPLKGSNFLAADSCCDSIRHMRAAIPINGKLKYAQRFAVDYEQIDAGNTLYKGPPNQLTSFHIYGQEVVAVAHGIVVKVIDGLKESIPGAFPLDTTLQNADGNSVILKIAPDKYALYAHLQPGSIRVKEDDQVTLGQTLALVGNSGNSLAPHLHFQIMDSPSPFNANGLPYLIRSFNLTALAQSTEDFDKAESLGIPLSLKSTTKEKISNAYPMDLSVLSF